jgi:hypothetical protein
MQTKTYAAIVLSAIVLIMTNPSFAQSTAAPDLPGNDPHWIKVTDSNCWTYALVPMGASVTWTGACTEQLVSGSGTLKWYSSSGNLMTTATGNFSGGMLNGAAILTSYIDSKGIRNLTIEGVYKNGQPVGNEKQTSFFPSGKVKSVYVGNVSHDGNHRPIGEGTITVFNPDGSTSGHYEGLYKDGVPDEKATADRAAQLAEQQAAQEAATRETEAAPLLAQRKHVGDTVCNTSLMLVGQVDRVENDKILIRIHRHENGYVNTFAGIYKPARDWEESTWVDYDAVVACH